MGHANVYLFSATFEGKSISEIDVLQGSSERAVPLIANIIAASTRPKTKLGLLLDFVVIQNSGTALRSEKPYLDNNRR